MDMTTIEPGTRAQFVTIERDELNTMKAELDTMKAELSSMRDDYTAQGEMLEGANGCVMDLESQVAETNAQIAALHNQLRETQLIAAIELRNVQLLRDQLRDSRAEYNTLHNELSKARRANVAIVPDVAHVPVWSEKQQDTPVTNEDWRDWLDTSKADGVAMQNARPAIEQAAYPDAELAREAGVSELGGEGESE